MFKEAPSNGSAARLIKQTALDNQTIIECLQNAGQSVNRMAEGLIIRGTLHGKT